MRNRKPVIDYTRVAEGFLFDTHLLRCQYLGKTSSEKPRWLEEHKGQFQRLEDVLRESAQLGPPDNIGAAPTELNRETSSPVTRKDADDDDNVNLVGTPPERCSPPCQPESVPARMNENVPSGSAQIELLPSAEATTRETERPKTAATPLGAMGRKQGRRAHRQLKKQKLTAKVSKSRRKLSPERMRVVLECLSEYPIQRQAARKAGIYPKTLAYWIKRSEAGDDGYDIEWQGWMLRFHEHVESAIDEPLGEIFAAAFEIAKGVPYKKYELGYEGPRVYVRKPDEKMIRFLLEWREKYGNHPKIDIPQKSGVVVIGNIFKKPAKRSAASIKARQWRSMSAMVRTKA